MPTPSDSRRGYPDTYFVQDRSNEEELARLLVLDQLFTAGMGGVLPEQPNPAGFRSVLDVGCGTGGWLLEVAKTYPEIETLVGGDISRKMLNYARAQAEAQGLSDRVQFHPMDALQTLEFPTNSFDLVNHRSATSWLRTWDWPKLLQEYRRITRGGGVIRVTENDVPCQSTRPAHARLLELTMQAFYRAGHFFTPNENGASGELARLLHQYGIQAVQTREHNIEYESGTAQGQLFVENARLAFRTMVPFLRKWAYVPDDYETLYQQMLEELQQPDFVTSIHLLTAWGINPPKTKTFTSVVR